MEERSFDGVWWLPGEHERVAGGRFSFTRESGSRLEILGELLSSSGRAGTGDKVPVVLGSIAGTEVTLFDVNIGKTQLSFGRKYARQEYRPELVVVGGHLANRDDLRSDRWEIRFTQLAEWLETGGFAVEFGEDAPQDDFLFRVTYRTVDLPSIAAHDIALRFGFATSVPFGGRSFNLSELAYVDVTLSQPAHFDHVRSEVLWPLQNFLTFAVDRKNTVAAVFMKREAATQALEVLYQSRFESDPPADSWAMLFPYSRIADRASTMLSRWLEMYRTLGPPLNSLFSVIYGSIRSTDTKFLNIVQAAESYHRRMYPVTEDDHKRHEARVQRLVASAPAEDAEWLAGKLAYSGEPFLTARLITLFDRLGKDFYRPMFASRTAMRSGARRISDWRNKLTHMRATPAEIADGLFEIHVCTNQLLVCLKANLLLELGFDQSALAESFKYSDMYNYFARHDKA